MKSRCQIFMGMLLIACIASCTKTDMELAVTSTQNSSNAVALKSYIYMGTKSGFYCLNGDNGVTKWLFQPTVPKDRVCGSTPMLNSNNAIFNLGDSLYAVDFLSGVKAWSVYCPHFRSAITSYGYRLFVGTPFGTACFNGDNGALIWQHKYAVGTAKQNHNSSPTAVDEVVYVGGGSDNNIYALNAGNGDLIWKKKITNLGAYSSPCVYNDKVYMLGDSSLFALNIANGALLWQKKFNYQFSYQSPTTFGGKLLVAADSVYAFNRDDGSRIWAFGDTSAAHYSCSNDIFTDRTWVYAVFNDIFYKLDLNTGTEQPGWGNTLETVEEEMVASAGHLIYQGYASGRLFCNSSIDNTALWSKPFGGAGEPDSGSPITLDQSGLISLPVISGNLQ